MHVQIKEIIAEHDRTVGDLRVAFLTFRDHGIDKSVVLVGIHCDQVVAFRLTCYGVDALVIVNANCLKSCDLSIVSVTVVERHVDNVLAVPRVIISELVFGNFCFDLLRHDIEKRVRTHTVFAVLVISVMNVLIEIRSIRADFDLGTGKHCVHHSKHCHRRKHIVRDNCHQHDGNYLYGFYCLPVLTEPLQKARYVER